MPVPAGNNVVYVEHWDTVATGASSTTRQVQRSGHRLGTASFKTSVSPLATATMSVISDATPAALAIMVMPTTIPAPSATIFVQVSALDNAGRAIGKDYSVAMFGPPGAVRTSGTAPPNPTPIFSPGGVEELTNGAATFTYGGGAVNPLTVIAIAGTYSETAQLFPVVSQASCGYSSASIVATPVPQHGAGFGSTLFRIGVGTVGGSTLADTEVDTGSTGVEFPVASLPASANVVGPGKPWSVTLSPSGKTDSGNDYLARLQLKDDNGDVIGTTIPMEIEGLTQSCPKGVQPPNCKTSGLFAYVGIGFDRGVDSDTWPSLPLDNPVLQLTDIVTAPASTAMHPGYILSSSAIQVGLDQSNTAKFAALDFNTLTPSTTQNGDWNGAQGCITINTQTNCGAMLLDVGQTDMYIDNFTGHPDPSKITSYTIAAPTQANPLLHYGFTPATVGTAPAPDTVFFDQLGANAFVNLGTHAIAATDYLYDAACGRVGYASPSPG